MSESTPDLRKLLIGLGEVMHKHYPGIVEKSHVKRVADAKNTLLVLSRVMMGLSKKVGVTDEEVAAIVSNARLDDDKPLFVSVEERPAKVTGNVTDWDIVSHVDQVLLTGSPPEWFVDVFWPPIMRRVSQGKKMTDRERAIASYVASTSGGER